MNISIKKITNQIFFSQYQNFPNLKKLGLLVSFSSVLTPTIFYIWLISSLGNNASVTTTNLIIVCIFTHLYLTTMFIYWSLSYDNSKWLKWAWLSFIFISPFGAGLIFALNNVNENEEIIRKKKEKSNAFNSLSNSFTNIQKRLENALKYLHSNYPEKTEWLLSSMQISSTNIDDWDNKRKFFIIAVHEALRQNKKKTKFDDIVFFAHWYDQRRFDFAIKDPKANVMPVKYKYSLAFIVLDEFNNYQKILDAKKEIKANIKFGTAKIICLHWGKGFKVYVNE